MLTVNDLWAKEVENTKGQDRIVTADKMDEGQGSTEKVEKTGELQDPSFAKESPSKKYAGLVLRAVQGHALTHHGTKYVDLTVGTRGREDNERPLTSTQQTSLTAFSVWVNS